MGVLIATAAIGQTKIPIGTIQLQTQNRGKIILSVDSTRSKLTLRSAGDSDSNKFRITTSKDIAYIELDTNKVWIVNGRLWREKNIFFDSTDAIHPNEIYIEAKRCITCKGTGIFEGNKCWYCNGRGYWIGYTK